MKRKVILLVGAFLLVLGTFLAWRRIAPSSAPVKEHGPVKIDVAKMRQALVLERRDNNGRPIHRLEVPQWEKNETDGSYECVSPSGVYYGKDAQRVYVRADAGTIYAEGVSGEIRRGIFRGNVKVFFDNYKSEDDPSPTKRPPLPLTGLGDIIEFLEDHPFSVVRVYVPDLDLNYETLLLQTEGPVTALADKADLFGTGLEVTWNQSPQELVELKIRHGQRADIYDTGREESVFALPGGRQDKPGASATTVPAVEPFTVETLPAPETMPLASRPKGFKGKGVVIKRSRPNVYLVTFQGRQRDVRVVSGRQSLEGAEELSLQLELEGALRERALGAASRPGTRPSTRASTRPRSDSRPGEAGPRRPVTIEWDGPLVLRPMKRVEKPSEKRYVAFGHGQKVILRDGDSSAICREFSYRNEGAVAELKGTPEEPARLDIGDGQLVVCERILFQREIGLAHFPKAGYMARIRRPDVSKAQEAQDRAELEEATGLRDLDEIKRLTDRLHLPSDETADKAVVEDKITWGGSVLVSLKERPVLKEGPVNPGKQDVDGLRRQREYIEKAHFKRDVRLQQGRTGDYVQCDDLEVMMGLGRNDRPYPVKAVAKGAEPNGRVMAWQHGSHSPPVDEKTAQVRGARIEANEITVTFREKPKDSKTEPRLDIGGRSEPVAMMAVGDVVVTDTSRKDPKDVVRAFADRIDSNVLERSAVLYGKTEKDGYARLTRGQKDQNVLAGAQLQVEDFDQRAIVKGPGFVRFLTDKDLNARKLAEPRPLEVTWTEGMTYLPVGPEVERPLPEDPKDVSALKARRAALVREAVFTGNVVMNTGDDSMACHRMTVELDPPPDKPEKAATAPALATTAPADRSVLTVEDFGSRKLFLVAGEGAKDKGKVLLNSLRLDEQGFILRRLWAESDKLLYFAGSRATGSARIEVPGPGKLFNEDYRFEDQGGSADGPSQSFFEWRKSMVLLQNADRGGGVGGRTATMHGNVSLVHHSGRNIRIPQGLKIRHDPARLREGRITHLDCQDMVAEFDDAADKDKKSAGRAEDVMTGPAIGRISLFSANGADADRPKDQPEIFVQMMDGPRTIVGKRLLYDRREQIATAYGYLLGRDQADAEFRGEDMDGNVRSYKSPKLTIRFDPTGKKVLGVVTEGGTGKQ